MTSLEHYDDESSFLLEETLKEVDMTSPTHEYGDSSGLIEGIQEVDTSSDSNVNEIIQSNVNEIIRPGSIEDSNPRPKPRLNVFALNCALGASITSILLGFDVGAMNEGTTYIKKDRRITDMQVDGQAGILHLLSLLGSVAAGQTSDRFGRRSTIIITGACFFIGTFLMAFSDNNAILLLGQIVTHLGIGFALMIAPVYISEISPAFSRGLLNSLPEVFMNLGTLIGYFFNYPASKVDHHLGRTVMATLGGISLILLAIGVFVMPESPRWLVMQGRLRAAKRILTKTSKSEEEADLRLTEIKEALGIHGEANDDVVPVQSTEEGLSWSLLYSIPYIRHMLICAVAIHLIQQASGIDTMLLYSTRIFEKANVTLLDEKLLWTIKIHIIKTVVLLIPTFSLDWVGRRKLLLSSILGMIVSLATLGTCLDIIDSSNPKDKSDKKLTWAMAVCIPSFAVYVASFSIGTGPITAVYSSEVLPLRLRAQGYAVGVAINQALSALLSVIFLMFYKTINLGAAAFSFMGIACFAWLLIFIMMPETQGQTLEDMWKLFGTYTAWMSRARGTDAQRRSQVKEIEMEENVEATEAAERVDREASH